ncbi:RDD family protein [Halorussus salinus]|uniref:RDD family protein n=1 Tax=Halorussus salinus TaxID=1364935 RepID=UPI001091D62B|nr:RDD family protein [Halorussus salinus]
MPSPSLSLFGVIHADRPAKVRAELDEFAADADALFIERPETEITLRTFGRVAARTPTFLLGMFVQLVAFVPLYVLLHREYDEAEAIAVRRVAADRGLPVHEVDDHPVLYMSRAGPRWILANWAALAALAYAFGTAFAALAGLLVFSVGATLLTKWLDRRLWLVAAIPATVGPFALAAANGLVSIFPVAGVLVFYAASAGLLNEYRNSHMLERISTISGREGYDRACLVTGKAHVAGLAGLAADADLAVSRVHVSRWLRRSDDVTDDPDPEEFGGSSPLGWLTTAFGLRRPEPARGTETAVFGRRIVAAIVDLGGAAVASVVGGLAFGVVGAVVVGGAGFLAVGDSAITASVVVGLVVAPPLYYLVFEATLGRTPGKWLLGLVVVAGDGSPVSRRAVLVRNLLRPLDLLVCYALGFVVMLATDRAQRLGDAAADTVVVRTE